MTNSHTPSQLTGIRCVAFDAVGTVMDPQPSVAGIYTKFGRKFGSQLSDAEITQRFHLAWKNALASRDHQTDEVREREFWQELVSEVLPDVSNRQACFAELFNEFGRPEAWRVFDDVATTVTTLQQRGYTLGLASNFDARLHAVCAGHPELSPISLRVISSLVGFRKPDANFYQQLIALAGCPAEQILMVGDTFDSDVAAARACGLQAVWLDRTAAADTSSAVAADGNAPISRLTDLLERLP